MARKPATNSAASRSSEPHLPAAELDVMSCLWQEGEATARRVREMMKRYRPMAHGSVVTLLVRLEKKALVTREKGLVGKAFVFKPARRPDTTYRLLLRDMLQRVFGGDIVKFITSLVEAHPPSPEQAQALQALAGKLKGKKRNGRG